MGATTYAIPTSSGLIEGTAVSDESSLGGPYKGGSLLGWNLYGVKKSKILIYDNAEKAEGTNFGPVTLNEHESIRDWFGSNGIKFKTALYLKVLEGEVEGVVFAAVE